MKTAKKVTALLLAVVMVLALSVSAFAATNSTATLQVYYGGVGLLGDDPVTITLTSGMTAKGALDLYADDLMLEWKTVSNLNPRFGDTPAYAIDTIYGYGSNPLGSASGISAQFWSAAYPGYGIEYTETVNGETVYHFIYVGEDWSFKVNGVKPEDPEYKLDANTYYQLYMDQYVVQADDVITVTYEQQIERWTDTTNWLGGV